MSRLRILLLLLCLGHAWPIAAQEDAARERVYRLGMPHIPGYMTRQEDGSVGGFAPRVLEQAMKDEGLEAEWVDGTWTELFEAVKRGEIDALPGTQVVEERLEYLDYCENNLYTMWSEFYLRDGQEFESINELSGKRIGLVRNDANAAAFVKYVDRFGIDFEPVYYDSHADAVEAMHRGDIFGLAGPTPIMMGELFNGLRSAGLYYNPAPLNISFPKGKDPEFRDRIDHRIGLYKQDPDSIYNRLYHEYGLAEMRPERRHLPHWVQWTVGILSVSVVVFTGSSLVLRRLVAVRTRELRDANAKLRDYSQNLESKVAEKTSELAKKHENLQTAHDQLQRTQDQLVQSEKMATLGRLAATFAHEINSPLGAIGSTTDTISASLDDFDASVAKLGKWLGDPAIAEAVELAIHVSQAIAQEDLSRAKRRELSASMAEQLATVGVEDSDEAARRLAGAGVYLTDAAPIAPLLAHEDCDDILKVIQRLDNIHRGTKVMRTAVGLMTRTIASLKNYARRESSGDVAPTDLVKSLETVLMLYQGKRSVKFSLSHDENLPAVEADADAIQQVWTNLIFNALQAMEFSGELTVRVFRRNEGVSVAITDTGCGIPEEIRDKIFDPLFTTKPSGEGCGLGLDIVQRIVERHHGALSFESTVGRGATFTVWLPLTQEKAEDIQEATAELP